MKQSFNCLWLLVGLCSWASASGTEIESAKTAYWKGDFSAAAAGYRQALKSAENNADLWFNLGTAEAQAGRLGYAVHALEQALLLKSDDDSARHNLERVREQIIDSALKKSSADSLVLPGSDDLGTGLLASLPRDTLNLVFAIFWPLFFLVLMLSRTSSAPGRRTGFTFASVIFGMVALSTGGLIIARAKVVDQGSFGILIKERTTARRGPGNQYAKQATLAAGVKVRVSGQDRGWQQVTLPNGLGAWVQVADVKRLNGR